MSECNMPEHMQRRGGGVYYIRRVIPLDLQPLLKRREIARSLRTKEFEEAKRRCRKESLHLDERFDQLRADLRTVGQPDTRFTEALRVISEAEADAMQRHELEASEFFAELYASEDEDSLPPYPVWAARQEKRDREDATAYLAEERRRAKLPLLDLFEQYASQPGLRIATVQQWRGYMKHLIGFLGHDNALAVKPADLRRWRDRLATETGPRGKPRKAKTINDSYLASVRAVLGWALDRDLMTDNAAASVKPLRSEREQVLRGRDLTKVEQATILRGTLAPPPDKLSSHKAAARRWGPWLCAYTGLALPR